MFRALIHAASVKFAPSVRGAQIACVVLAAIVPSACSHSGRTATPARIGSTETGVASWYGNPYHGRRTASGEIFDMERLTAAHKKFPFQTWVEVTNLTNGKQVKVRITDRGPFVHGRIIDLSLAAARDVDMVRAGTARVRLKVIRAPATEQRAQSSTPEIARVYAVQVGAFTDRSRAEALSESLGFSQARVEEPDGASPLWRVLVGHDLTKDAAEALASELRSSAGSGMVVQEKYTSEE